MVYTGNPFFPYLMGYFPGRRIPHESYLKLLEEQQARLATGFWEHVQLPWTLTMANPDAYIFVGPMALALSPLLLLFRYRHPSLMFLVALLPLLFLGGLAVTHILKFSVVAFLVLYLVLGAALAAGRPAFLARSAAWVGGLVALACFSYLASIAHHHYDAAGLWAGKVGRDGYLQGEKRVAPYQKAANWISAHLPAGDRVLVVGGSRGLYLGRPFINQSVFDEQILRRITRASKDEAGILRALKKEGVDALWVAVEEGLKVANYDHYDLTSEEWARLDGFLKKGTDLLYLEDLHAVHRLRKDLFPSPVGKDRPNPILYFSAPAARFVHAVQRGRMEEAERELQRVLELYPFSEEWRLRARLFRGQGR
jgi:hypothetical protein